MSHPDALKDHTRPRVDPCLQQPFFEPLERRLLLAGDITVTIDSLATSDTTPALTGTVDDPLADILVRVDGINYSATNNGDTTWTLADDTVAALSDGTYDVVVLATNGGSFGVDDTTDELIVDTVDPVVTVDSLTSKDDTPALTGTISETDATISVNVDGVDYVATNNGNGTWTLADDTIDPALDPGTYDVAVTATDVASNIGTDATTDELVIDPAPIVTIDDLITNDTSPALTGTIDEDAATIVVTVDGADYDATNNQDGTWTLADDTIDPALADGTYDVVAAATGAGGVGTDDTTDELIIDTVAPTVAVDALVTEDGTPQLTGTVDDGLATVAVTVNGTDYDATNNGDGTWTLDDDTIDPSLAQGIYDVAAAATDSAGNEGTDATTDELEIDLVPTVTIDELTTNVTSPALAGTIDDADATVVITVGGSDYDAVNNGDGTWRLAAGTIDPALAHGTYDIVATATDLSAKEGADDTTDELVIDTVAPTVTVDAAPDSEVASPELTGTVDDDEATIAVTVDGADYAATNNGDGTWTLAAGTIAALEEGTYDVEVAATDAAGNIGADATTDELTVDLIPVVTVDSLVTDQASPELTGTVDDPDADVFIDIAGLTLTGAPYQADVDEDGNWTLALNTIVPDLADSTYNVVATAIDGGAKEGTDQTSSELVVDTVAPTVTIDPLTTDRTSPEFTGTVDDPNATVTLTVEGSDYSPTNNGDGTWTLPEYQVLVLSSGTHTVTVMATDAAGNESIDNTDVVITADAPAVTIDPLTTTNRQPQLTGTVSDPDATILLRVAGHIYEPTNNGDGTWTLPANTISPSLGTGTYEVDLNAEDAIGNIGMDDTLNELTIIPELVVYLGAGMRGVTYRDPDGTVVTIRMKHYRGSGSVRLSFASDSVLSTVRRGIWPEVVVADAGATLTDMIVSGKPAKITIVAKGGNVPGTTLGGIGGSAEIRQFTATGTDLINFGLDMTGYIRSLRLRSIQADVLMTGVCERPIQIKVSRQIEDANIRITNCNVAMFQAGSMIDSSLYVGTLGAPDENSDGVFDLPEVGNLLTDFRINKLTIKGYRGAGDELFVNSNIGGNYIGTAKLMNARLNNEEMIDEELTDLGEFGIAANTLGKLTLKQDGVNYTHGTNWLADPEDLTVRLV